MPRWRLRLVPRDESFFELFVKQARNIEVAADALLDLISDYRDVEAKASHLRDLEHEGDEMTHEVMRRLNTVFVTPLDHEDIHKITSTLDDVLDHMEAAADLFVLHKIDAPLPEMKAQADVLVLATRAVRQAFETLPHYAQLSQYWIEVNRLENDGDRVTREAVAALFEGATDPMVVIRWKDIYERLEEAIDSTERTANILEGIVLKNA